MLYRTIFLGLIYATGVQARTALVPDAPVMRLDEVGIYEVGYAYRGQPENQFPVGWFDAMDERTGVMCAPIGEHEGRQAFLMHCPWRGGTGIAFQQYTFHVPVVRRVLLRGATAMRADAVGKSDGATFRVFVGDKKLLEVNRVDSAWQPFEFDLTAYAGHAVTLRFETDPGPKNNSAFDFSLWGDRELVLEGYKTETVRHRDPPPLTLARLISIPNGSVVPVSGFDGKISASLNPGGGAAFKYSGPDGDLEYRWQPGESLFGSLTLLAPMEIPLANSASLEWSRPAPLQTNRWEQTADGIACIRTFKVGATQAVVKVLGRLMGKSLVFDVTCDQPLLEGMNGGVWGPVLRRRLLPMPYYTGQVDYLPAENMFVNSYLDWTVSRAAWHEQMRAHYVPLTDGRRNRLHERVVFSAAWHLAEVLPNIPNAPSPYREKLAGKIVLDIWGGQFVDIAKDFEMLSGYGITNCVALVHCWQRSGYDNALPAHYPADAGLGGDDGMKTLVATGTSLGYDVALHENYVDYYPNFEGFNTHDVAVDSKGQKQNAWFHPGTKIQSFAVKPTAILKLAATQSPEIHRRYRTNADYLDVHSCVPPWFHVDLDSREAGAGDMQTVWNAHRELWQYERRTHGGPVFGEGNRHWLWSGLLDGVEAQFGSGWGENRGLTAPLLVDFDLLKIHPLQFNHGMGYYERWWPKDEGHVVPPMVVLDQYRMQEVAYGHAGFLGAATWRLLPMAWLEHHLLSPVMTRYATAVPVSIDYDGADGTAAAKVGNWKRVHIVYGNGLEITANGGDGEMQVGKTRLPGFGWSAEGAGITAGTVLRDGIVADHAETADQVFVNARSAIDWNMTGLRRVRPQVADFTRTAPRSLRFSYRWQVGEVLDKNYSCFVHFYNHADSKKEIKFQQDHPLTTPTSEWKPGQVVTDGPYTLSLPEHLADGDYVWAVGLWLPREGRAVLEGAPDGEGRIRLGVLKVKDNGRTLLFEQDQIDIESHLQKYRANINLENRPVDFGVLRTDGSVLVRREGSSWVLLPYPRTRDFLVELSAKRFGQPRQVVADHEAVIPVTPGTRWRLPLNGSRQYRWPAE